MNEKFRGYLDALDNKLQTLLAVAPTSIAALPKEMPAAGIYLLSEGTHHLYVGRSRRLRHRLRFHSGGQPTQASFAFLLARETAGRTDPPYTTEGSRQTLWADPVFRSAFAQATERIRKMDIRYVEEPDAIGQALLEIYVAVALDTPYNKFKTS
jgi:hypothetical protein